MLEAAQSLVPIVLLVALGAVLRKREFIDEHIRAGLDKITYWVALPSLFIQKLAATNFEELVAGRLALAVILGTLGACALALFVGALLRLSRPNFGVFVQAGFRGNLAFVGLPLVIFSLGGPGEGGPLVSSALVTLAALIPISNAISVLVLMVSENRVGLKVVRPLAKELATNPLILSALLGGFLGLIGWRLPVVIDRPLDLLGGTAIALALVSLGGALIELEVRLQIGLSLIAGALKVAVFPVITYLICRALNLPEDQTLVAMIFAACPSATASYILTVQLGGNRALAATCVVASTVMSLVSLTVVLLIFT